MVKRFQIQHLRDKKALGKTKITIKKLERDSDATVKSTKGQFARPFETKSLFKIEDLQQYASGKKKKNILVQETKVSAQSRGGRVSYQTSGERMQSVSAYRKTENCFVWSKKIHIKATESYLRWNKKASKGC